MRSYDFGTWGLRFAFSFYGSVFPKAFVFALPNAGVAVALWYYFKDLEDNDVGMFVALSDVAVSQVWVGYNWVLGFIVGFRAQRAYARWWEGGTLLQQARGEWFNAYSSLIAFTSSKQELKGEVDTFQELLGRLMSMLYAAALSAVSREPDCANFEIIDVAAVDVHSLFYLLQKHDKCEVILQWVQRLIVENMECGVLPIPPPVISRVFQELSRGIVNVNNVRKITEFPFPFPIAQFITFMLILHWFVNPIVVASLVGSPIWAALITFVPCFALWGLNYIAAEIEQPFGDDVNDMPMRRMQLSMNTSIVTLLERRAQDPPAYIPTYKSTTSERRTNRDTTTVMDCALMVVQTVHSSGDYAENDLAMRPSDSASLRSSSLVSMCNSSMDRLSAVQGGAASKPSLDDIRNSKASKTSMHKRSSTSTANGGQLSNGLIGVMRRTKSKLGLLVRQSTKSLHANQHHVSNDHVPVSRRRISTVQRGAPVSLSRLRQSGTQESHVSDGVSSHSSRQHVYSSVRSATPTVQAVTVEEITEPVAIGSTNIESLHVVMPPRAKCQAQPFTTPRQNASNPDEDPQPVPASPVGSKDSTTPVGSKDSTSRRLNQSYNKRTTSLSFASFEAEVINWEMVKGEMPNS